MVLSLSNNLTPSIPNFAILWISAIGPIGVKSNLKSPVSKIVPFGVLITIAKLSGIEWVVVTKETSKYLYFKTVSLLYSFKLEYLISRSSNFFIIKSQAILDAYISGILTFWSKKVIPPIWSSCPCVITKALILFWLAFK